MRHSLENREISASVTIFSLLFILSAIAYGGQLAVIELKHRPADEVIPVISPFLGPADTLSGQDDLLFLSTTPENLTRIQSIIAHLDRASRQLAVTVVQGENAIEQLSAVNISGKVSIGDHVTVGVGDRRGQSEDSINLSAQSARAATLINDIQRVLVQEGATATIYVGISAPVPMGNHRHQGMRYHQIQECREVFTGVHLTPRISGDRVMLGIESQNDQPSGDGSGVVRTQHIQTQIQGQLNEWIEIGSILGASNRKNAGLVHSGSSQQFGRRHVFVKVEEVRP
ncbi:MAG: hypothetical protein HGJ94_15365 [Desulfosarcina sp.]|nr:hypothetical protein [Desulfosarcina sp.]MBC2742710.1 hypothetical protein [Desulfosarcina sp.]MBC2765620.1 hypothetical protein [Desulfosarcina sp.]